MFEGAQAVFIAAEPHLEKAYVVGSAAWEKAKPYKPEELITFLIGFVLCFYGGAFCTTIAAVEAFRMCGLDRCKKAYFVLKDQYYTAEAQMLKDDGIDDDGDGIPDVKGLSTEALMKRKIKIALKTCDPDALSDGFQGIYSGLFAVIATLQLRFAQVLTLGSSLGDSLHDHAKKIEPAVQAAVDPEFRRWVPQIMGYACKALGVSCAWMVQRVIFGFTSAMKGGQMLVKGLRDYLVGMKFVGEEFMPDGDPTLNYVEIVVSSIGFYSQFTRGFSSLGYAAVLLFPVSMFEWILGMVVGKVA